MESDKTAFINGLLFAIVACLFVIFVLLAVSLIL
jgi:hypothetical protein